MQSLLGLSQWDEDALRDEVPAYVVGAPGNPRLYDWAKVSLP